MRRREGGGGVAGTPPPLPARQRRRGPRDRTRLVAAAAAAGRYFWPVDRVDCLSRPGRIASLESTLAPGEKTEPSLPRSSEKL